MHTILFDLDGTLLSMDMDRFEQIYFSTLSNAFPDEPDIAKKVWMSTEAMVRNLEPISNERVFTEDFAKRVSLAPEEFMRRFMEYYRTDFDAVAQAIVHDRPLVDEVRALRAAGYRTVLATNPLFPLEATVKRLRWAGFEPEDFTMITTFEDSCYLKPHLEYYRGILAHLDCAAEDCMMVGNDVLEDGIARELGITTYLITDHILNRKGLPVIADHTGSYDDFRTFARQLCARGGETG